MACMVMGAYRLKGNGYYSSFHYLLLKIAVLFCLFYIYDRYLRFSSGVAKGMLGILGLCRSMSIDSWDKIIILLGFSKIYLLILKSFTLIFQQLTFEQFNLWKPSGKDH